jgi:hypothetical protein
MLYAEICPKVRILLFLNKTFIIQYYSYLMGYSKTINKYFFPEVMGKTKVIYWPSPTVFPNTEGYNK